MNGYTVFGPEPCAVAEGKTTNVAEIANTMIKAIVEIFFV